MLQKFSEGVAGRACSSCSASFLALAPIVPGMSILHDATGMSGTERRAPEADAKSCMDIVSWCSISTTVGDVLRRAAMRRASASMCSIDGEERGRVEERGGGVRDVGWR